MDLWRLWSKKTGVPIEFSALPWDETLNSVKEGSADIHAGLFYTKERDTFLDYGEHPLLELDYHFFYHNSIKDIHQLEDLIGFQIGVPKGYTETFMRKRLPKAALTVYANFPELYKAAEIGEIKAFISPNLNYRYHLKTSQKEATFNHQPDKPVYTRTYLGAVKQGDAHLLGLLNKGLASISPEERVQIEERWLNGTQTDTKNIITIANRRDMAPFSMFSDDGKPTGILQELWRAWGKHTGQKIAFRLSIEESAKNRVIDGKADIAGGLYLPHALPPELALSDALMDVPIFLYTPSDGKQDLDLEQIAAPIGYHNSGLPQYLGKKVVNSKLVAYRDARELVYAMTRGEIKAFITDQISAEYAFLQTGTAGEYSASSKAIGMAGIYAAFRKDESALLTQVNQTFLPIDNDLRNNAIRQWLGTQWTGWEKSIDLPLTGEEKAWLAKHPAIDIGVDGNWPPIDYIDALGNHRGIAADYIKSLEQRLGIKFNPIPGPTFKEMLNKVITGELKVGTTITSKPSREEKLIFTEPFLYVQKVIVTNKNYTSDLTNIEALYDKTVAIEDGFNTMKQLQKLHPRIQLKSVETTLDALKEVSWGKADAYIGNQAVAQWLIRQNQFTNLVFAGDPGLGRSPQNFAVTKADPEWAPLAGILEKALGTISESERIDIENRWLGLNSQTNQPKKATVVLSDKERQWLKTHKSLRLGIDPFWPPVEYFHTDGETYLGMASDVVALLSERLDVAMKPTTGITWPQVHERARNKEIDILPTVTRTATRDEYLNFTSPYLIFPQVIFTRNDVSFFLSGLGDLTGRRIVVERGYVTEERLKHDYPNLALIRVGNTVEALNKLSSGEVDAYVGNLTIGSYLINEHGLNNIKVAAPTPYNNKLSIGVRKDWPEMLSIMQKALDSIAPDEMGEIRQKWMKIRYEKKIDYRLLWQVAGGALIIIILTLVWVAQIHRQRKIVSDARDQAEQASRFKSEFLANMSHEIRTPMNAIVGLCHLTSRTELTDKQHDYMDKIQLSAQSLLSIINDILDFSKIEAGKLKIESVDFDLEDVLKNLAALTSIRAVEKGLEIIFEETKEVPTQLIGDPFRLGQILLNLVSNAIKFTEEGEVLVRITEMPQEQEGNRIWLQFEVQDSGIGIDEAKQRSLFSPFTQADGSTTRKYGGTGLGLSISRQLVDLMGGEIGLSSTQGSGSRFFFKLPSLSAMESEREGR